MKIITQFLYTLLLFILLLFYFSLPTTLFAESYSDILLASDSTLLGARIAPDGQWRFPALPEVPDKLEQCILTFEDHRFRMHPGIDFLAMGRAIKDNLKSGHIVSGGSTITMQVIRLSRKGKARTIHEKVIEALLALRIECSYSKDEILAMYLSHAPFGGNTIGAETAAWRYFGSPVSGLSWAESALLAVLPNAPALIHPGRNRESLKNKRDRLLTRLYEKGIIDDLTYSLSLDEPIPQKPSPLPMVASHLLDRMKKEGQSGRIYSSIDPILQRQILEIVNRYAASNRGNFIHNMGVLVMDIRSAEVLAYIGNPSARGDIVIPGGQVDMVRAERSTGSLLKPILYAGMLEAGQILPYSLIPDIPLYINGFAPHNYDKTFHGAVPADIAISRSLNVPLVRMLMQYDYSRFYDLLVKCGMNTLYRLPAHYGLSLVLGGAEGSLWNMTTMYASMARTMQDSAQISDWNKALMHGGGIPLTHVSKPPVSKASLWFMIDAMSRLNRPEEESEWQSFSGMKQIAWKTGTSYGARDAWAIGFTPRHIVGVWVGNATGEGRPGLSGVEYAAPVLFDVFSNLPVSGWFSKPENEMKEIVVCRESGFRSGPYCVTTDTLMLPPKGSNTASCPYHRQLILDKSGFYRVDADCYPYADITYENRFILPPTQEYYYRQHNPGYLPMPPMHPDCQEAENRIDLIYPKHNMRIFLPVGFTGKQEKIVFKAVHSRENATLYWHVGDKFYGETNGIHELAVTLNPGNYFLTLVDETGYTRKISFVIIGKSGKML